MAGHDAVVHFAAETHVDRSIAGPDDFINTNCFGTNIVMDTARRLEHRARHPHRHRRGVRIGRAGLVDGDRPARAALPVLGVEGGLRPHRALVPHHLRAPGHGDPVHQQLRAVPVPGEGDPALHHQPARRQAPAALRRRPQRARLAATSTTTAPASHLVLTAGAPGEIYNIGAGNETPNRVLVDTLLRHVRRRRGDGRVRRRPRRSRPALLGRHHQDLGARLAEAAHARRGARADRGVVPRQRVVVGTAQAVEPRRPSRQVRVLITGAGGQVGHELRDGVRRPRRHRGRPRRARRRRSRRGARRDHRGSTRHDRARGRVDCRRRVRGRSRPRAGE